MKLFLMRHGPAEDHAPSGQDEDRALAIGAEARVRSVADALVHAGEDPFVIATSQLVRAVQTAEIVASVTKLRARGGNVEVCRELAPGGDASALISRRVSAGTRRLMLVGHEPDLTHVAKVLVVELGRPFDKAMVVGLHVDAGRGAARLRFVLDPKTLRFDPDTRQLR